MISTFTPTRENRPFQAFGAALQMWRSGRREVLMVGPAGTGKTRAELQKIHFCALKYPGMRAIICRKTRESITQTAMVTYEKKVLPEGWLGDVVRFRTVEQQYEYSNGSIIAVGGLDKPTKVMSSEWDIIYVQEAIELEEEDWESLVTRLRNGVVFYQQLLADTNPGPPNHWLKKRGDAGKILMLNSRHEDNPTVTKEYLEGLDTLTGVRYLRLRKGVWAAAEGMVYQDEWDPAIHLINRFDIPASWPRYWSVDFGYRNPFVCQMWALSPDDVLYRYREIYFSERLVEDHAKEVIRITSNEPRPVAIICDTDAEDRATFERHTGYDTIPADKSVSNGIQAVKSRLKVAGNGKAGVYFFRDSLVERDPQLEQKSYPLCTEAEFESYVWDIANGRKIGEEPVKKYDHGMDALRYMCKHITNENDYQIKPLDDDVTQALQNFRGW